MNFKKHAIIIQMVKALRAQGSWTGKTHVQKSTFLLQEVTDVNEEFQFVLYKHGPYSFEIENELEQMKSYGAISIEAVVPYGVELDPGENAYIIQNYAQLTQEEEAAIDKIGVFVGSRNVSELERIATAVWVRKRENIADSQAVASRVHELKPHISVAEAIAADQEVTERLRI